MIRGLAELKLDTIADRISVALNDDKITDEAFRLILSEVDNFNQTKNEIRRRQKQSDGLSEDEKKDYFSVRKIIADGTKLLKEIKAGTSSGT